MGEYTKIDLKTYARAEHFLHFMNDAPCTISLADDIDVTALREACRVCGQSFSRTFLYVVSYIVNSRDEFRMTACLSRGKFHPAVWDVLHPVHNVFHEDTETYTSVCTRFDRDMSTFLKNAEEDTARAGHLRSMSIPAFGNNTFETSCLPWRHFTSVGISHPAESRPSLAPVIVWGGFRESAGRTYLPLSVTIHHAAADGFHLARFLNEAETLSSVIGGRLLK